MMLKTLLDTLIPGDNQLNMPSASLIDFNAYQTKYGINNLVIDLLLEITKISEEQFSKNFMDLNGEQRIKVLNKLKLKDIRLFSNFLEHVFKAYYSDKRVLSLIGSGSLPPFPDGNFIDEDD